MLQPLSLLGELHAQLLLAGAQEGWGHLTASEPHCPCKPLVGPSSEGPGLGLMFRREINLTEGPGWVTFCTSFLGLM